MGTEIDRLGGYGYRATDTAGVRSNHQGGEMGAGHVNLRGEKQMQQRKVGREEEGSSSNRLELAAFVLTVLCGTPLTKPMLYLYDHQVLLKDANTWAGEGGKATLVQTTDADILREAIKEFGKRTAAGSSDVSGQRECESRRTYKRRSQADKAISSKDIPIDNTTNRTAFTWQEPRWKGGMVSYGDQKSTWKTGMRKAIRRGSAEEVVCKHQDRLTGAWNQISKQKRLVDESYDPTMATALQHCTYMDEESFNETYIEEKGKRIGIHQRFYGTWTADFIRQDAGKFMLRTYLFDKQIPWRRRSL